jgi:hypothetical protein
LKTPKKKNTKRIIELNTTAFPTVLRMYRATTAIKKETHR